MSHKAQISTSISHRESLLKTLDNLGIKYQVAEDGNTLDISSRYGVKHKVNIQLKSDAQGKPMTSVGFEQKADGTFEAVGDFYELHGCQTKQGQSLSQQSFGDIVESRYTYERVCSKLKNYGFQVMSDVSNWNDMDNLNFVMQSTF